jgi:hypothetical protein
MTGPTVVYSKVVSVPSKAFPCITRKKLAINDIVGDSDDGFTRIPFELMDGDIIRVVRNKCVTTTSDLPKIIPPLPEGDTKDLKVWKEYWVKHDANTRNDARLKLLKELEEDIQGVSDTLFGFLPVTDSVNKTGLRRWIEFKRKEVCK